MTVILKNGYKTISREEQKEVRNFVLEGLEQIKQGKTKVFDEVCDRLEKKYSKVTRSKG